MRLLVTGAKGFTGRHFVPVAQSEGYEVVSLGADLCDAVAVKEEVSRLAPEMVVHLAGISFVCHANPGAFYDVNVMGTQNLLDALLPHKQTVRKILLVSSANIYGNCDSSPISEDMPPAPLNHYAISKLAMEYMARTYSDRLSVLIARSFNYTGPGQSDAFLVPKLINHFLQREKIVELGNIDIEREFNDVRFVCQAYLKLLKLAQGGEVYNVCSGRPVALKAVLDLLQEISGHVLEVQISRKLIRPNEIQSLCGNPSRLFGMIGRLTLPPLRDTLSWMYYRSGKS